jgi:hypothetical protein
MAPEMPFDIPSCVIGPEHLRSIVKAVAEQPDLWEAALRQTTRERTYTEVHTSEHLGVWAISWMADDHDTGYHDHHASSGAVFVVRGAIRHERLHLDGPPSGQSAKAGEMFCFDATFIHRMRREPGATDTVTIHAYSPPLTQTGQYSKSADGHLRRQAADSKDQLAPKGPQGTPTEAAAAQAAV